MRNGRVELATRPEGRASEGLRGEQTAEPSASDLFLPEPEPRPVRYTVISVDDHLVEPADMFEGRLAAKFQDRAPRIVETEQGQQV